MAGYVDRVNITVKAGNGGDGCVAFHREKFVAVGGPDGGDGGKGGDIYFMATERMNTLLDFRYNQKHMAENGVNGSRNKCYGRQGRPVVIEVPPGTLVLDAASGRVLLDLFVPDERKLLLKGGRGGWGNAHFATPTRQAPDFAKPGEKTSAKDIVLELKSIADVGLVGFPNVGKSTLLSVVTAAKPKIANYPFTTLQPNLGIVRVGDGSFAMADIPGLIEGASEGAGLGHDFLRHVERTRLLVHVLDASGSEGRDPLDDYDKINLELSQYGDLKNKPQIIAANKMDLPEAAENLERLEQKLGAKIFPISAATREGVAALTYEIAKRLSELPPAKIFEEVELPPEAEGPPFTVRRQGDVFIAEGPVMDWLLRSVNFDNEDSLNWFHRTLLRTGVIDALRGIGAGEGSTVQIGDMEFDFID